MMRNIAAFSLSTGELTGWNPVANRGVSDIDIDNGVDGKDLAEFAQQLAAGTAQITIKELTAEFGK